MLKLWHISYFFRTFFTFAVKISRKRLVYRILCRNILFNNRVAGWLIVYHLDYRLDDVHSPNAGFRASTSLHLAHRIHKNRVNINGPPGII